MIEIVCKYVVLVLDYNDMFHEMNEKEGQQWLPFVYMMPTFLSVRNIYCTEGWSLCSFIVLQMSFYTTWLLL